MTTTRGIVTNLCLQSESLTVSPWSMATGATGAYAGPFPTGVGAMTTITENGSGLPTISQDIALNVFKGQTLILSGYATKVSGTGWLALTINAGSDLGWINIGSGAPGSTGVGASIQVEQTNVAGIYRWWYVATTSLLGIIGTLRFYVVNGNGVVTHTLADAIAIGGIQIEVAAPGQTTPSPYVATGATTATGRREYRQNLLKYSEDLTNAAYTGGGTTFSPGSVTESAANIIHYVGQTYLSRVVGAFYTFSVEVKANGRSTGVLEMTDNFVSGVDISFDLIAGTGTVSSLGASWSNASAIVSSFMLDGYRRITAIAQSNAPGTVLNVRANLFINQVGAYLGDGVSGLFVRNFQLVQNNGPSSYIKTTSAPANPNGAPRKIVV